MTNKERLRIIEATNNLLSQELEECKPMGEGFPISQADADVLEPFLLSTRKIEWSIGEVALTCEGHMICGMVSTGDKVYVMPGKPETFKYEFWEMMDMVITRSVALKYYKRKD